MARRYSLSYTDKVRNERKTSAGKVVGNLVTFRDDEDNVILEVSKERANEIASWHISEQLRRINARLEAVEVFIAKEYADTERPTLHTYQCDYCKATVTWIDDDFHLHAIPWCSRWRAKEK